MSGHSKWANIKRKKGKNDAVRGKIFTKLGKEIAIAAKAGGNPETNSKLADVVAKAKANNMPNDTIQRAIKKGSGDTDGANYEEIVYEGYGPSGMAVIVKTLTDNRNRTAGDVRHIFDKNGGSLGTNGCVDWMFDQKGVILVSKEDGCDEDELMMQVLELGAEDMTAEEEYYEVLTTPESFSEVRLAMEKAGISMESAEVSMIPQTTVAITDEPTLKLVNRMIDMFDDNDDVQDYWHNAELPEEDEE